ncbi:MAG: hypothetical protein JSS79_16235 [Bacteroidetes bacterium]|nr:hypothetical protein [Bacteroidota bacterium]
MKYTVLIILCFFTALAQGQSAPRDSVRTQKQEKRYKQSLNVRLHNQGQFMFSGRIISPNPALDFFYQYDRKQWGFVVFKAFDLYDHTTDNNFGLAMIRKNFHVGKRLTITPQAGFIFEQSHSIADKGTDLSAFVINTYKVSSSFSVEYTAVFFNLAIAQEDRDWVNRLRLLYSKNHWDVTVSGWHNNKVIDHDNTVYFSTGASVFYSRMKINDHLHLSAGASTIVMAYTTTPDTYPVNNGVFFTVMGLFH